MFLVSLSIKYVCQLRCQAAFSVLKLAYHNERYSWTVGSFESHRKKTCLRGFRPCPTQSGLYNHRKWLDAWNFGYRKKRNITIYVAKTKAITAQVFRVFVFAYAKIRFTHDATHLLYCDATISDAIFISRQRAFLRLHYRGSNSDQCRFKRIRDAII